MSLMTYIEIVMGSDPFAASMNRKNDHRHKKNGFNGHTGMLVYLWLLLALTMNSIVTALKVSNCGKVKTWRKLLQSNLSTSFPSATVGGYHSANLSY